MNREILFRGKSTGDLCPWVYGYYHYDNATEGHYICDKDTLYRYEVDPETIGQATGLKDCKEIEIYEGDIVNFIGGTCDILPCGIYDYQHHKKGQLLVVRYLASGFTLSMPHHLQYDAPNLVGNIDNYKFWNHARSFELVGNIYQNSELLQPNQGYN